MLFLNRILQKLAVFLILADLKDIGRSVFYQIRVIAFLIENFHHFISLACSRHPEPVFLLIIERLKFHEQLRVVKEMLKIISPAELEYVDALALFSYVKCGHDIRLHIKGGFHTAVSS